MTSIGIRYSSQKHLPYTEVASNKAREPSNLASILIKNKRVFILHNIHTDFGPHLVHWGLFPLG
jgi:hypothetical protein